MSIFLYCIFILYCILCLMSFWIYIKLIEKDWLAKHIDGLSLIVYDNVRNPFLRMIFRGACVVLNELSSNHFMRICAALTSPLKQKRNRGCRESSSFVHKRIGNYRGGSHKCCPSLDRFIIINYPSCARKEWPALWEDLSVNEWPGRFTMLEYIIFTIFSYPSVIKTSKAINMKNNIRRNYEIRLVLKGKGISREIQTLFPFCAICS